MSRPLKRFAPSVLGLIGSGIGLVYSYALLSNNGDGCSCGWPFIQAFLGWPMVLGSLIGLAGCALYLVARRAGGGVLLLAGSILLSPFIFFSILAGSPFIIFSIIVSFFGVLIAPMLLAGLLMFLGGLLAFPRTRHLIKRWHDEGWIP